MSLMGKNWISIFSFPYFRALPAALNSRFRTLQNKKPNLLRGSFLSCSTHSQHTSNLLRQRQNTSTLKMMIEWGTFEGHQWTAIVLQVFAFQNFCVLKLPQISNPDHDTGTSRLIQIWIIRVPLLLSIIYYSAHFIQNSLLIIRKNLTWFFFFGSSGRYQHRQKRWAIQMGRTEIKQFSVSAALLLTVVMKLFRLRRRNWNKWDVANNPRLIAFCQRQIDS